GLMHRYYASPANPFERNQQYPKLAQPFMTYKLVQFRVSGSITRNRATRPIRSALGWLAQECEPLTYECEPSRFSVGCHDPRWRKPHDRRFHGCRHAGAYHRRDRTAEKA